MIIQLGSRLVDPQFIQPDNLLRDLPASLPGSRVVNRLQIQVGSLQVDQVGNQQVNRLASLLASRVGDRLASQAANLQVSLLDSLQVNQADLLALFHLDCPHQNPQYCLLVLQAASLAIDPRRSLAACLQANRQKSPQASRVIILLVNPL